MLLPILARYLEPEDFGKIAIFAATLTFAGPFVHMSLFNFMTVEYFQKEKNYISSLISGIIPIVCISGIFYSILLIGSRYFFGDFIGLPYYYYLLIPIVSFLYNVKAITLAVLRNSAKALYFGILNNSATILYLGLAVFLVVSQEQNWKGRVNAEIIAAAVVSIGCLILLKSEGFLNFKINKDIIKENFQFSFPLIPSLLALTLINLSDRFFIKEMVGEGELGMYSIGNSLGMIISFALYSFEQISIPILYKRLSERAEKNKVQMVKFTYLYIVLVFFLIIGVTLGTYLLLDLNFLPEKYLPVKRFIMWIALAYGFWGLCAILAPYIEFYKKTKYLLYASLIGCVFNLIANYFFILNFGAIGAAYSKVLTFFLVFILYWYFGNKLEPMPWFTKESFKFKKSDFVEFIRF